MKKIVLLFAVLIVALTGCKSDKAPDECINQTNEFVQYFRDKDFESMYEMTKDKNPYLAGTYDANSVIGRELFDAMTNSLKFEITSGSRNGKNAYVNAHITTINTEKLLTNVVNEYTEYCKSMGNSLKSDDMDKALKTIIDENLKNTEVYDKDTSVDFVKENGKWIIEDNVGIYDDLSGGYLTYCFRVNYIAGLNKK